MKQTTITLETPYKLQAVVEEAAGQPPTLAEVSYIMLPFEGCYIDVTTLVLADNRLCTKLAARAVGAYQGMKK